MSNELARRDDLAAMPLGLDVPGLAHHFVRSGLFKDAQSESAAITKIVIGRQLGIDAVSAMTDLHLVHGKVQIGAHILAAAVKASPKYDYQVRKWDASLCTLAFYENGKEVGESTFTIADAQAANLTKNQTWKAHPRNMLFARAMSNGYKVYAPDVFMAPVYTPGEIEPEPQPQAARPSSAPTTRPLVPDLPAGDIIDVEPISPLEREASELIESLDGTARDRGRLAIERAAGDEQKLQQLIAWAERQRPTEPPADQSDVKPDNDALGLSADPPAPSAEAGEAPSRDEIIAALTPHVADLRLEDLAGRLKVESWQALPEATLRQAWTRAKERGHV